ncbi:MAG TPA: hypothetical protein VNT01_14320 [Symbiobacteriaceae bacterium]|nr:hypothetical protein [Symbiobacteriaceae bacterium]
MSRIAVIGSPGAGKSTLSRKLGQALGLEVHHLDRLYWQPGWVETPRPDWIALQQALVQREAWIIDGNYGGTMEIRLARAQAVICLDYSRWVCLWGAAKRRFDRQLRPDMAPGCPEHWELDFFRYIWQFPVRSRVNAEAKLAQLGPEVPVYRLRSRREAAAFLDRVRATGALPLPTV